MLFPLFLSLFLEEITRLTPPINKDIAYKIISIFLFFLFFDTFFSLRRLKEKFQFLPCKSISCESYFSL